ncbi:MAG: 6-carboxytetrahydropterin synthase QueD [Desulfobacterales bacterium C00003106]|jgi:6-pyruvoyltetrahydropterin/6-carboxytetrahydropterin synthase|nr:MAG: 6-carboxytetrahydropterin synthase QueD [Desulfobacterales bacterium C00003106]OEU59735.1 MAG: 6-carboxytetrahydropterin synthase QueD [Desulfobacterales bacterium C00003104]
MFELKTITHFAAAHQLRNFGGPCENLHGHNWKIEISVASDMLNETGIVVDFAVIKKKTAAIIKELDHQFLNNLDPFKDHNPSSENIAQYIAARLSAEVNTSTVWVARVTAWESDNACATYYPDSRSAHP